MVFLGVPLGHLSIWYTKQRKTRGHHLRMLSWTTQRSFPPAPFSSFSQCVFYFSHPAFLQFLKNYLNWLASVPYSPCSLCLECYALSFPVSFPWSLYFKNILSAPLSNDVISGLSFLTLRPKVIPSSSFFHQGSKYLLEPSLVKHFDKMMVYKTVLMYKSIMYYCYYITLLVTNHIHPVFLIAFKA